jgi:hypothetical protein
MNGLRARIARPPGRNWQRGNHFRQKSRRAAMLIKLTAGPARGADALLAPLDLRVSTCGGESHVFSPSCGCLVGTSASSQPRFICSGAARLGYLPTRRWAGEAGAIDPPKQSTASGARKHGSTKTAGTGLDNLAHDGLPAKRRSPGKRRDSAVRFRYTLRARPAVHTCGCWCGELLDRRASSW